MKEPYEIEEECKAKEELHTFSGALECLAVNAPTTRRQLQADLDDMSHWEKLFSDRSRADFLRDKIRQLDEGLLWDMREQADRISDKIGNQTRDGLINQIRELKARAWSKTGNTDQDLLPSGPEWYLDQAIKYLLGDY